MAASSSLKFLCPTPQKECCGASVGTTNGLGKMIKAHGSSKEAMNCYTAYLLRNGYVKVGSREYRTPDGTILVLNKQSKFGHPMRRGKSSEKGVGGNRFVPKKAGDSGGLAGVVMSV